MNGVFDRRAVLRAGVLTGGGLFFALGSCKSTTATVAPAPGAKGPPSVELNAFVLIHPDNSATIRVARSEMGQGVRTTLALLVAEELDLDWARVKVEQAWLDKRFGEQGTGGSESVLSGWVPLREASAQAKGRLLSAAAQALAVDRAQLTTRAGEVLHVASGRRLTYAALAGKVEAHRGAAAAALKDPKDFTLLGQEHSNLDAPDIVRGAARYGLDTRKDKLLFACVERAPVFGARVVSFNAAAALKVPGVKKVLEVPAQSPAPNVSSGVAVVAQTTWAAMQGRRMLEVQWSVSPSASDATEPHRAAMERATAATGHELVNRLGDPDGELRKAGPKVVSARYEVPFIAHATMEPMNFTAEVVGKRCHLIGPTQEPGWAAESVATALGLDKADVSVEVTLLGGGFGRRLNPDVPVEAALVARQLDAPVQVVWTREDDLRHDFYRPPAVHVLDAALDAKGAPHAWRHRIATQAITATLDPTVKTFGLEETTGASSMLYRVPHRSCEYTHVPTGVTAGWWRGVFTTHTTFAVESFLDELAHRAGQDPYTYRLGLIDELQLEQPKPDPNFPWSAERLKGVLTAAAQKAGWGRPVPKGHGVGIACGIDHNSYAAEVVEVSVIAGALRVERVVCAVDCGRVLNPNGARAQVEGGVMQALSAALREKITIAGGRVEQGNFDDYPIARIGDAPRAIEVHFVNTEARPSGLGEPSVPPLAPALANAIFQATGKRLRTLPFVL